jgi:alginate O-acetyltransferase complex protein AlgI
MLFNSYTFAAFFALLFAAYWLLRERVRLQNVLVLVGSLVFYGWWDERFLILILVSIVTDFITGWGASGRRQRLRGVAEPLVFLWATSAIVLAIAGPEALWIAGWLAAFTLVMVGVVAVLDRLGEATRRRAYLWVSVSLNLGMLGVFKYFNFFAGELQSLAGQFGWELSPITLAVILPVGISFYTFQTLSYTIDIYRGKLEPTKHLIEFAAFVSFFPQLVAGPIERASHLLPQFFERRSLTMEAAKSAVWLFAWGLCKKVVIADNLAAIADPIFATPEEYGSSALLAGLIAFTFQIYCDFSGYSDMARGSARLLGFELMLNFNLPYFARTPSEFWQRWHISLSSWLRDYLYIPLGGNRMGPAGVYRNLALTMLLGGLWHGANWTFIAWGAFHGAILIAYRACNVDRWLEQSLGTRVLDGLRDAVAMAVMFVFTVFGWLLFRAESMADVGEFLAGIFTAVPSVSTEWATVLPLVAGLLIVQMVQMARKELEIFTSFRGVAGLTLRSLVGYSLVFLAAGGNQQFIYFDF